MTNSTDLSQKKCIPCSGGVPRLHGNEIETLFEQLHDGWKVIEEQRLEKEYPFANFKEALKYTNNLGSIAEEEGHHPDIYLSWGKVKVILWTHKINGLSESDFIFAAKCDQQYTKDSSLKDL